MITDKEYERIKIKESKLIDTCNWCKNNKMSCDKCIGFDYSINKQQRPCPRNEKIIEFTNYILNEGYRDEIS